MISTNETVIAGIIDCRTGEIIETATTKVQKRPFPLKVRDELNAVHGKDAFYAFDFELALGFSLSYIRKLMKSDDPQLTHELVRLHLLYKIANLKNNIATYQSNLEKYESAAEKCCALFDSGSTELSFVSEALEEQIEEHRQSLSTLQYNYTSLKEKLLTHNKKAG